MTRFLLRRGLQSVLTVLGVITAVFFLVRLAGDPTALLLPAEATAADTARLRAALGLDQPLAVQFWKFLLHVLQGDFGNSVRSSDSAMGLVLGRLPATLELALTSFGFGIGIAFLAGIAMRLSGSRWLQATISWITVGRQAIPIFSFALVMILVFSVWLRWLPSLGRGSWQHLVLPAVSLGSYELGLYLRLFNASLAAEEQQDYVRCAYAKGLGRARTLLTHMLPNALLPLVTVAGINLGLLLGGTVITEMVFSWPGVGRLIVQSVSEHDYPVIIAGVFMISVIFVALNLVVDLLYGLLDPRVKLA